MLPRKHNKVLVLKNEQTREQTILSDMRRIIV
jgi:hypothetical protein